MHPQHCLGFRLHGIFLGGQEDVDWWFHGCRAIFPDHWQEFAEFVQESERADLLAAYYTRLTSGDPVQEQAAAQSLRGFSARTQTFEPDTNHVSELLKPEAALAVSRILPTIASTALSCRRIISSGVLIVFVTCRPKLCRRDTIR